MYKHALLRINYTTYDIRRSQDIINYNTSRRDVMVLADDADAGASDHPFWYARILGIYHVNVIYAGPGMTDYTPRRLDFLFVRWFHPLETFKWADCRLDQVAFPPMADEDAFGFLDPRDVLRACHIVPTFSRGMVHSDEVSMSQLARDSHDWKRYYVNKWVMDLICCPLHSTLGRIVDRDMIMRYHWGLAVGHEYTRVPVDDVEMRTGNAAGSNLGMPPDADGIAYAHASADDVETRTHHATGSNLGAPTDAEGISAASAPTEVNLDFDNDPDANNLEFSLEDQERDDWDESDGSETAEGECGDIGSDEESYFSVDEASESVSVGLLGFYIPS